MRRYVIERSMPGVGERSLSEMRAAATQSNAGLAALAPDIQWVESYITDKKTFCVYLAKNEKVIRRHGKLTGFPVTKITEVRRVVDPTTATVWSKRDGKTRKKPGKRS